MPFRPSPTAARPLAAVTLAVASLLAAAAAGSVFLQTARDAGAAIAADGPASPADGILVAVALVGTVLSLWVGLGMALAALSALPGAVGRACSQLADRIAPAAVRKVVAFILGTALTAALVPGTAVARTSSDAPRPAVAASAQHAVRALPNLADAAPDASFRHVTDNPRTSGVVRTIGTGTAQTGNAAQTGTAVQARDTVQARDGGDVAPGPSWSPEIRTASPPSARGLSEVVVLRGDSLWSIAARHLGPAATTAEIDTEWHRWFAANRQVIGADADVIAAGQVLRPPASAQAEPSRQDAS